MTGEWNNLPLVRIYDHMLSERDARARFKREYSGAIVQRTEKAHKHEVDSDHKV